jgi:hypothetical protein
MTRLNGGYRCRNACSVITTMNSDNDATSAGFVYNHTRIVEYTNDIDTR